MNLSEQIKTSVNEVSLTDALNSSLMELTIKRTSSLGAAETNDLVVYVDKETRENPTENRKQYLFELLKPLAFCENVSDEFTIKMSIKNNKVSMETFVKRLVGESETGELFLLTDPVYEMLDYSQIILFTGENYIYTNYENVDITLIYPKDNAFNKLYLNSAIYVNDNENREECTLADIYYSNCFTKTEDRINLSVNNIDIDCITSKNNKFSLDEQGNLIVKTITVADPISSTDLADIYPIGSIYMNVNNVDPSSLFGGVWECIKGRFLFGTGEPDNNSISTFGTDLTYDGINKISATVGSTGGTTRHKLTVDELPSHKHSLKYSNTGGSGTTRSVIASAGEKTSTGVLNNTGGSLAHNNMPPYLAVNMWKRVG